MKKRSANSLTCAFALLATCAVARGQIQLGDPVLHQFVTRIVTSGNIAEVQARHGLTLARSFEPQRVYVLEGAAGDDDEAELAELEGDNEIELVEKNRYIGGPEGNTQSFFMSVAPAIMDVQPIVPFLQLPRAQSTTLGAGVTVAILDTGVSSHPRFSGQIIPGGYDFVLDSPLTAEIAQGIDTNGNGVADQLFGHGTFVTGLTTLVAPGASILPIRVLDSDGIGSSFTVASGIYHAIDNGANVINLSLATPEKDELIDLAIQDAEAAGIVVIASTGNNNEHRRYYPAAHPTVLSVSATDIADIRAPFSNYGSYVEMSAPGTDVVSVMPDGSFAMASGTSFSAAIVSGTAALARAEYPGETAAQIRARMITRGPSIDALNPGYQGQIGHDRVAPAAVIQPCSADFNADGFLDYSDFDAFIGAFESGFASSDINMDGFLDFSDFDAFVAAFEGGC